MQQQRRVSHAVRVTALSAVVAAISAFSAVVATVVGAAPAGAAPSVVANSATAHGGAPDLGPGGSLAPNFPLLDIAATPTGGGYWLLSSDGGIFSFGDAGFHGSTGAMTLNAPVVGMAPTPSGGGYWLVASDGGIFAFGDARFFGSTGGMRINRPVVGIAATRSGAGYWLVADDGGVFAFGDARFLGSAGDIRLARPVVGMAATRSGAGYWLVADDGGVFTYGDAPFYGSMAGHDARGAIRDIAGDPRGSGYWLVSEGGYVYPYGAPDGGNAGGQETSGLVPTVGMAASPSGGYWLVHGQRRAINKGERGRHVAVVQKRLNELSYWVGPADGVFDHDVVQALWAFQKLERLPVTGNADFATFDRLQRTQRPVSITATGDVLEINKTSQVLHIVRGGRTMWTFHVSTGTEGPYWYEGRRYTAHTPTGHFEFLWSVNGPDDGPLGPLYRPRYFTRWGIAVHGSPSVPLYPASHGCVRVTNSVINFIWAENLAPMGSKVFVHGTSP